LDTVEFRHAYRTIPVPTAEDRIVHGLHAITDALMDTPPPTTISQLDALSNLRDVFESWRLLAPPSPGRTREPMPGRPRVVTPDTPLPHQIAPPRTIRTPRSTWATSPPPLSALRQRHPMWPLSLHDGLRLQTLPLPQGMRHHLQGWAVYHLQGWPLNGLYLKPLLYHQGYLLLTAPGHVPMLPWHFFLATRQSMRVMFLHQRVRLRQPPSPWDLLGCVELTP
jgi:hypothetical protein